MKKFNCIKCGVLDRQKNLCRLSDGWYCSSCKVKRRHEKRKLLREEMKKEEIPRNIKVKAKTKKEKTNKVYSYISKQEKQLLLRKYMKNEHSFEEAKEKVGEFIKSLAIMRKKLKDKGKTEEEVENKFREEYEKLLYSS